MAIQLSGERPSVFESRSAISELMPLVPFSTRLSVEGATPSERTEFFFLYDDLHLYVAFHCHDSEPEGIVARNRRMADRAAPLFDQGGTLVAVGALHLSGEHGLVELLRARGYRVEPIY